jgi:hypothetical protein
MKITERTCYITAIIILALFCDRKMSEIEGLELIGKSKTLASDIKSDQINELSRKILHSDGADYSKGFEDGKNHAMLAIMHGDSLINYADGYHAAIDQMYSEVESSEIKAEVSKYMETLMERIQNKTLENKF